MIIILRPGSSKEEADKILSKIKSAGLEPLFLPGEEKIVLGAIGDERVLAGLELSSFSSVEKIVPVLKPHKLSNRQFQEESSVVDVSGVSIGGSAPVVIAGPCSVESEEQIVSTAKAVKASGAVILRGGAWKPRTSPYSFQGLEQEGLEFLVNARSETGLPFVTEVVSDSDVDLVAQKADMLQIGARNMQNFRLLQAVGETRVPVLLKRGPVASLNELLMAAEYIMKGGNSSVVLCERGIKTFFSDTRNTLDLAAVPLLKKESHLPVIVDPSHGTGVRELIAPMSKAALAVGADGLIIEVHPEPDQALSDGFQQLDFQQFAELSAAL